MLKDDSQYLIDFEYFFFEIFFRWVKKILQFLANKFSLSNITIYM